MKTAESIMARMKIGNGSIPLRIGNLINTKVYGGPYRNRPDDMFGVKMAQEIQGVYNVSIPTPDYGTPAASDVRFGVILALMAMINGEEVYAGCMGGIGRTGLFLGILAKVQIEYRRSKHRKGRGEDPIEYVREHFIPHAIETKGQEEFIRDFDVSGIIEWIDMTQTSLGLGGLTPPKGSFEDEALPPYVKSEWIQETDSADDVLAYDVDYRPAPEWAHIESLQNQIDEMQEQVDQVQNHTKHTFEHSVMVRKLVEFLSDEVDKRLTKPTIFERIKAWFGK